MPNSTDNLIIITGGPGSGKSALVDALAAAGFDTAPEGGRALIRQQVRIGGTAHLDVDRFAELGLAWPYVGPRNGHVTLHSRASLEALWGLFGLSVASFDDNLHLAYATVPAFAQHLF